MQYQGYYGAKSAAIFFNKLKEEGIIPTLSTTVETAIVLFLVCAFLGFASRRMALRKQRLENEELTEKSETNSMMRRILY